MQQFIQFLHHINQFEIDCRIDNDAYFWKILDSYQRVSTSSLWSEKREDRVSRVRYVPSDNVTYIVGAWYGKTTISAFSDPNDQVNHTQKNKNSQYDRG